MKYEIYEEPEAKSIEEVVGLLYDAGAFELDEDDGERISGQYLECGADLEVYIENPSRNIERTETFTLQDLTQWLYGSFYTWARDEDGDDVLLCFN